MLQKAKAKHLNFKKPVRDITVVVYSSAKDTNKAIGTRMNTTMY